MIMANHRLINGKNIGRGFQVVLQNYTVFFSFLLIAERVFLLKILEDSGMGYLALPMDLFLLVLFGAALPLAKVVSGLMKLYIRRSQLRNARKIGTLGFCCAAFLAILFSALLLIGRKRTGLFFGVNLSWIAVTFSAVAVFFAMLGNGAKSFVVGVSADVLVTIGYALEVLSVVAGSVLGASLGKNMGLKVTGLLRFSELQYVYCAAGVMAGIAVAQIIAAIYWCLFFVITRHALALQFQDDPSRRTEESSRMLHKIFSNVVPTGLLASFSQSMILLGQWLFLHHIPEEESLEKTIAYWGCFYGKYLPFMMIPIFLCVVSMTTNYKRIVVGYETEDGRQLRDGVEKLLIKMNAIGFTGAILTAVLGQAYVEGVCGGMITSVLKVIQSLSVVVVAYCYFCAGHSLLHRLQYHGESLLLGFGAFVISFLTGTFLLAGKAQSMMLPGALLILYFGLAGLLALVRVYSRLKCRINWMKTFAYPLFASCISGLVVLLLGRAFMGFLGPLISLILGVLLGFFVEVFSLLAFRIINENQASHIPFGSLICYFAKLIGFL